MARKCKVRNERSIWFCGGHFPIYFGLQLLYMKLVYTYIFYFLWVRIIVTENSGAATANTMYCTASTYLRTLHVHITKWIPISEFLENVTHTYH